MKPDLLATGGPVLLADGAWSTELRARGIPANLVSDLANLTHPQVVAALAREYATAGARVVCTNTFAANRLALAHRKARADVTALNRRGVELAREGGGPDVLVGGVIGPTGRLLAVGEASEQSVSAAFAEQARVLAESGADVLVLETFSEVAEVLLAVRAARSAARVPVVACMSFDSGPQRTRTMMGAEAGACAAALEDAGADAIGFNCGGGVAEALPAVFALRSATRKPLWVKPNAGSPDLVEGRPVYTQSPEDFGGRMMTLVEAGADIVGGCCGVGPAHIRRLAVLLESRARRKGR